MLPSDPSSSFAAEWLCLQNNHEQYERTTLWVKLSAIVVGLAGLWWSMWLGPLLVAVLWLQEAILRTSQARLGERILRIEVALTRDASAGNAAASAFQLHSEWLATRPGTVGLLREYIGHALRPTVAFPYVVLVILPGTIAWGNRF